MGELNGILLLRARRKAVVDQLRKGKRHTHEILYALFDNGQFDQLFLNENKHYARTLDVLVERHILDRQYQNDGAVYKLRSNHKNYAYLV